jgi:hypothetical protein
MDSSLAIKEIGFSKKRFRTYFGNIGEMIAEEVLIEEGYTLCELKPYATGKSPASLLGNGLWNSLSVIKKGRPEENELKGRFRAFYMPPPQFMDKSKVPTWEEYYSRNIEHYEQSIREVKDFFGDKLEQLIDYVDSLGLIANDGELFVYGKRKYTPDLIAKKNGEIYIIEVKANSGDLNRKPDRVKALLSAREFGLIPLIIHLNVGITASDFSMKELV